MTRNCLQCTIPFTPRSCQQKICSDACRKARVKARHNERQKQYQRKPPEQCGWCLRRDSPCVRHGGLTTRARFNEEVRTTPQVQASKPYIEMMAAWPATAKRLSEKYGPKKKMSNIIS